MQFAFQSPFIKPQLKILTYYHKLSQAGHAQDQENITPLQKIPNTVHFD